MTLFMQDLSMRSTDNRVESMSKSQTSASAEDNCLPSTSDTTLSSQPSSAKSYRNHSASSTSYLNGDSHGVKVVPHSNGYIMNQNRTYQAVKETQNMGNEYNNLNGELYHVNSCDVLTQKAEICCSGQFSTVETELSIKEPIFDSDTFDLSCQLECGITVSSSRKGVEHMKSCHQSEVAISSSPQNSLYAATLYAEAKRSFTNTEVSEFMSIVNKSGDSGETSYSCDFNESRKTSIYRESTGSDVSEESSSSSFSSASYKPHKSNDVRWEAIQATRCQSRDGVLDMGHFKLLRKLGYGDIGKVFLAELKGTRTCFAMKVMKKAALASRKKLQRAQTEREILQCLDHPFLPTLYAHFETDESSCLVMEYCPGGDLHALRQKQPGKYFREHAARFYVAEVLLALEYLHMLGIIYRDLKPENVLVREDGHIMLSDFDLSLRCAVSPTVVRSSNSSLLHKNSGYCIEPARIGPSCVMQPDCIQPACFTPRFLSGKGKRDKKIKLKNEVSNQVAVLPELIVEPTDARSMSFVGTHEYLAPEIIKGEGHGSAVDWWTFGVFLYELLFGQTPFKGDGNRATLFNVVGQTLRFPESPTVSFAARDLIRGLLVKEPKQRLAYRRGAAEIKQHPFFQSINWALIRCTSPPQVPRQALMDFQARNDATKAVMSQKGPDVDVKTSSNYLEIDFF